ncbi:hypothetical protein [Actinoalloteichus sp. GBA129-24]|uniref:hypothetical protein n=1 Tax=Actinoalloteichus sp. GBA129-24 TaxID=1612551 RepID=UPI0009504B4F|nr:hypothetical protein [Actinoalloteichus sp. GBA129-24]APU21391.1 hypothetical protein UA75_16935 [Actinoalloteichus sp. GBA129-24]
MELELVVDALERVRLDGLVRVDLGDRLRWQRPLVELVPMVATIHLTVLRRLHPRPAASSEAIRLLLPDSIGPDGFPHARDVEVSTAERQPELTVLAYRVDLTNHGP